MDGTRHEDEVPRPSYERLMLPEELLAALEAEQAQYRSVSIQAVAALRFEGALIALQTVPAAEQDWAGGFFSAFADGEAIWSGEVVHVDPTAGDIFLKVSGTAPSTDDLARAAEWNFKPFDFSQAISSATKSAAGLRLEQAVRWVHDGAPELSVGPVAKDLEGPWSSSWGLLWGPPGTGKTQALAGRIADAILAAPDQRLLLVAPTNGAVDELTHRLCTVLEGRGQLLDADGNSRVFRGGVGARVRLARDFPPVLHDADAADRTRHREALQQELTRLEAKAAPASEIAQKRAELNAAARLEDATLQAIERGHASVIALTVHRALRLVQELVDGPHFHKLILDEGGMISRASAALLAPLAQTVLIAGDPRQLGPVSRAPDGALSHVQRWLRESPLSILRHASRDVARSNVFLLRTQHRMHPAIAKVVSEFQYQGQLENGERPRRLSTEPGLATFPAERAVWVVLDECTQSARQLSHDRPQTGRGYVRRFSAELLVSLSSTALAAGYSVLAATPYRAQAQLISALASEDDATQDLVASTIHRQQGAEFDVVLIDTVAGGRPFQALDLCAMLNVAASRARKHLVVLSSRAEAEAVIPARFLEQFHRVRLVEGRLEPVDVTLRRAPAMPLPAATLGAAITNAKALSPLFTDEQLALLERQFGEGHYLVRGVAGSGKTFVLANWAIRVLLEHPGHRVLVSYFTKSLHSLETHHLRAAAIRAGLDPDVVLQRVRVAHVDATERDAEFDAVFVDEAQDMGPKRLQFLFLRAREQLGHDGKRRRRFFLFMDDSQNIYAQKPIEEFREQLDKSINFAGRTRVMKESFRSPREILDLAFNVVLDPLHRHGVAQPGLKEFLKENELVKAGLLRRPAEGTSGLYHVGFTEQSGNVPRVMAARDLEHEGRELARIVRMLQHKEQVALEDILVVCPVRPYRWAEVLTRAGFKSVAFGGAQGADPAGFPVGKTDFVRVTTIFSCKGHESPVVIFCGLEDLDSLEDSIENLKTADARTVERQKRCLFYVAATRATLRQYMLGLSSSRFLEVAREYAQRLGH
jgi:superfamily I DNA/RNA helicase